MKKYFKVFITIAILIGIFVIAHITPQNAIRTHIFFTGHPIIASSSSIDKDEIYRELETESISFYTVEKPPIDPITKNEMTSYKVTKKLFLFFAKYYGEA